MQCPACVNNVDRLDICWTIGKTRRSSQPHIPSVQAGAPEISAVPVFPVMLVRPRDIRSAFHRDRRNIPEDAATADNRYQFPPFFRKKASQLVPFFRNPNNKLIVNMTCVTSFEQKNDIFRQARIREQFPISRRISVSLFCP